jgi:large subunit ribosomal protein L6
VSRIGKLPVKIPSGVDVKVDGRTVRVKGPKGELSRTLHEAVQVERQDPPGGSKDGSLVVKRRDDSPTSRALHGLSRTLVANMVIGVTQGYSKDLEISGTGYRALLQGKKLQLALGFSHPVDIDPPPGISFTVETPQKLRVSGIDKEVVGEVAAKIRALRVPDPYKAKGVKYAGEYIRRKAGKAGKVGAKGAV